MIGDRAAWGHGYASEAIKAVTIFGFTSLGLVKITAGCYADNAGSVRAFCKAGFAVEARLARHRSSGNGRDDEILMCRFADDLG
jgi:RimJ/RimL family protein N-acetyltransferase